MAPKSVLVSGLTLGSQEIMSLRGQPGLLVLRSNCSLNRADLSRSRWSCSALQDAASRFPSRRSLRLVREVPQRRVKGSRDLTEAEI